MSIFKDYRATFLHPTNQTVSRFYDRLTVTISKRFTLLSLTKLSRVTTLSHFSTHLTTQLIHSLRSSHAPDSSVPCRSHLVRL